MREEQIARHWRILVLLEDRRQGVTMPELKRELCCSERTIYRDLAALESSGFPVCSEKSDGETRYSFVEGYTPGASLELGSDELLALYFSRGLLKMMEGTVFQKSIERILEKVTSRIPEKNLEYFKKLAETIAVGKEAARDYGTKEEILSTIMQAVSDKEVISIRYFSANTGEEKDRKVDPYKLWYANDAFYLIGWCHVHDMVRTFLVDRIKEATPAGETFSALPGFDFSAYHDDAFRVMRDGRKQKVVVRFHPRVAHCFSEKKWHPTQETELQPDGAVLVSMEVEGIEELKSWILSWGDKAEVLGPKELRKQIMETTARLQDVYEEGDRP